MAKGIRSVENQYFDYIINGDKRCGHLYIKCMRVIGCEYGRLFRLEALIATNDYSIRDFIRKKKKMSSYSSFLYHNKCIETVARSNNKFFNSIR